MIGVCGLSSKVVLRDREACGEAHGKLEVLRDRLRRDGWLYCVSCRMLITTEDELLKHLDELSVDYLIDESAWEDIPVGD